MKLSEFCINRPVFTIVLSLILVVVGCIGYSRLPIREMPNINHPVVSIRTNYPGASAALVETQVTTPLENSLTTLNGLDVITSESEQGRSSIRVRFKLGVDIDQAAIDVRNDIAKVIEDLPSETKAPVVSKSDYDANATLILSVTDKTMSAMALSDYVNRYIKPDFEELSGVAKVNVFGEQDYAMRIWLDPWKMINRGVTVSEVVNALKTNNQSQPGGQIETDNRYYSILTQSKLHTAKQFNDLILRNDSGYLVRVSDVGKAVIGPEDFDEAMRVNGKPAVGLAIVVQPNANPIQIANISKKLANKVSRTLPSGMSLKVVYNNADYVHEAMRNVQQTVVEAVILVMFVVFLFLGSWRSSFIPIVTIPVCLIAVFGFLYFVQYSINFISMLAVVLAIGLVVDDSIVMLENTYRHIENGMKPFDAAIKGSKEIGFAIVAMTLTLAAVYAPIGFAEGLTGVVFRQFAFTLAMAVIISGFVALTLSPMMCSRLLPAQQAVNPYARWLDNHFHKLISGYQWLLKFILRWRLAVIILLILLAGAGYFIYKGLPKELAPKEDYGFFFTRISTPTDSSFQYVNYYAKQIEKIFPTIPEEKGYLLWVGDWGAFSVVNLKPWSERKRSLSDIMQSVQKKLNTIPGINVYATSPSTFGGHEKNSSSVSLNIMTTGDYQQLHALMQRLIAKLKTYPGFDDPSSSLKINSQQFDIHVKRDIAAELGVNIDDINKTIATMLGGTKATTFDYNNYDYNVMVQLNRNFRGDFNMLKQINVKSKSGKMIPLSTLVTVQPVVGPENLPHYNRMRSAQLSTQLKPGYTMDQAVTYLQKMLKQNLPDNAKYAFRGEAKRLLESRHTMQVIFLLALLFIYLILAAQFESFIDPLIILFGVPLAIVGGLLTLKLAHCSLNIFSKIGLVTLIGLIAKHGILITNFANQLRQQGIELHDAIIQAASLRIRPILMTTAAMVIGALPLALAHGAGAHGRQSIGWVIVGGLLFGTFFSLFVVPVAYSYFAKFRK